MNIMSLEPWQTWVPPPHVLKRGIAGPDAIRAFLLVQELLRDYVNPDCIRNSEIQQAAAAQFHDFAKNQFAEPMTYWAMLHGTECGKKSG